MAVCIVSSHFKLLRESVNVQMVPIYTHKINVTYVAQDVDLVVVQATVLTVNHSTLL